MLRPGAARLHHGVSWGFTTRDGGPVRGPRGSLTLARAEDLDDALVAACWALTLDAVDPRLGPDDVALVSQVHGADVLVVDAPTGPLGTAGEADALVTTTPRLALAVRVADCVPLLLSAPGGVAAVHAGWRGVAARIIPAAVQALLDATGARHHDVRAVVGPHIQVDAFEVGPEVVAGIAASGVARELFARQHPARSAPDRWQVDLGAAVEAQLRGQGVASVHHVGACTTGPRFHSWRARGATTGRQAGVIARMS